MIAHFAVGRVVPGSSSRGSPQAEQIQNPHHLWKTPLAPYSDTHQSTSIIGLVYER